MADVVAASPAPGRKAKKRFLRTLSIDEITQFLGFKFSASFAKKLLGLSLDNLWRYVEIEEFQEYQAGREAERATEDEPRSHTPGVKEVRAKAAAPLASVIGKQSRGVSVAPVIATEAVPETRPKNFPKKKPPPESQEVELEIVEMMDCEEKTPRKTEQSRPELVRKNGSHSNSMLLSSSEARSMFVDYMLKSLQAALELSGSVRVSKVPWAGWRVFACKHKLRIVKWPAELLYFPGLDTFRARGLQREDIAIFHRDLINWDEGKPHGLPRIKPWTAEHLTSGDLAKIPLVKTSSGTILFANGLIPRKFRTEVETAGMKRLERSRERNWRRKRMADGNESD
uniref:Uncharacterized protein n=1 Tax=Mycena chlorophos TaxID=658473 RepID=A0ABQ0M0J1_MYCCL|nr:predicted protein [Mycena chlorophos]